MERGLCDGYSGTFVFQIVNVGDDINLNIFMSHFKELCS